MKDYKLYSGSDLLIFLLLFRCS